MVDSTRCAPKHWAPSTTRDSRAQERAESTGTGLREPHTPLGHDTAPRECALVVAKVGFRDNQDTFGASSAAGRWILPDAVTGLDASQAL